ncbi:heme peroxidase [Artemisia annua]|uniref:Heme peroxidase n=1 Tax=Artemisia annua TaxID=35608 RepID=A0A2U1NDN1_ARTAN|nr:heme peroxidase [Artemisia annua]
MIYRVNTIWMRQEKELIIHSVDRSRIQWHRLPVFLGLMYLAARRHLHRHYSLLFVGKTPASVGFNPADFPYRTPDGKFNDPADEVAGSSESFFGRNMLPLVDKKKILATMLIQIAIALLTPNPMVVATKLLARKQFIDTGKQLNLIAASWIQFMIHEWIDHLESSQEMELKASEEVANECPIQSFKFFKTKKVKTSLENINEGHLNIRTSWWDGSAIYGSNSSQLHQVRTYKEGKLKIANDGLLHHDENGLPITGDIRNGWIGVSTLQALFILEHNAVCDTLKKEYPDMDDENIFRHARLVTSAVIAKIHTIDWTVQLLKTDTLHAGMRANWYGLFGKKFKERYGHVGGPISGLVGLEKPNNYGVPYSLTEEFACVYRMHSLVPDQLLIRDINSPPGPNKSPMLRNKVDMVNLIGKRGEKELSEIGFMTQMVSMGHQACGALELWNYPVWLRDVVPQNVDGTDRSNNVDLASLEIYRDRERNVPRYNRFRRSLFLIPISKWDDLTDNKEAVDTLQEVYGDDVEQLDLLVGMLAEKKIKGFGISETAFIIFLLMASRRLEADRFFTSDYKEEVYTEKGMEWVNTTESLKDVLDRHYPQMTKQWMNSTSAFTVWDAPPDPNNQWYESIISLLIGLTVRSRNITVNEAHSRSGGGGGGGGRLEGGGGGGYGGRREEVVDMLVVTSVFGME